MEKFVVGAGRVLGRKLHVCAQGLGEANRITSLLQTLLPRNLELVLKMNVRSRQKNMDARANRAPERLPCPLDVLRAGAGQSRDDGPSNGRGNCLYRGKVAFRCNRETGLDDVHAETIQLVCQTQFFRHVHAAPRGLLAIPKRGVEYRNAGSLHSSRPSLLCVCYERRLPKAKLIIFTLVLDTVTK